MMNLELIRMIERKDRGDITLLLQAKGLGKDEKDKWADYDIAKEIIFEGQCINIDIYFKQIKWICEYLKI